VISGEFKQRPGRQASAGPAEPDAGRGKLPQIA
jgi:hypothetical protein